MAQSNSALLGADDQPVCNHEGILEIIRASASQVLTEPSENGNLEAFNKVQAPDAVRVSLSLGWDASRQSAALSRLKRLKQGTGAAYLCKLVSPEDVIENLALETIGTTRSTSGGGSLLVVELSFVRVRAVAVISQQWAPKKPGAAKPVSNGRVQPKQTERTTLAKLADSV